MKTYFGIIKDHFRCRTLIFKLAKSDLVKTYSGAALGWAWAIVKPTISILVFWFAFSMGLRLGGDKGEFPFILWLVAGYIPWQYMSDMLTSGANSIRKYSFLVTKIKYPISTVPTFVAVSNLFVHFLLMVIVVLLFTLMGFPPDIYLLQLPIYILLMFLFFISWGLFSAMLSAVSKDFQNLVKALTTAIFWMSGIMWDINDMFDYPWLQTIMLFNPVTFLVTGYRNVFIYKDWIWEHPDQLLYYGIVLVVMTIAATWSYKKLYKEIPDVL